MFSADGNGREWTNHTEIYDGRIGPPKYWHTPGGSCIYTSFEEVSPGRLFYVFTALNFQDGLEAEAGNCIRGVYIDVECVKQ